MAYTKQTWVDNNLSYPVSAARMGAIEDGIEAAANVADNFRISATAPASPTVGQTWYDSTTGTLREWNGSAWRMIVSPSATNGGVLQVAQVVKTDTFASAASGFIDITGFSVSITPKSTSNKILVMTDVKIAGTAGTSVAGVRLLRGASVIYAGDAAGVRPLGFGQIYGGNAGSDGSSYAFPSVTGIYLDSPASTSSVTYKVQILSESATAGAVYVNRSVNDRNGANSDVRGASSITLMEIAA
jgi:hypothetical protein